jgi:glycosyltransferase involved in cell wall biosynthesis
VYKKRPLKITWLTNHQHLLPLNHTGIPLYDCRLTGDQRVGSEDAPQVQKNQQNPYNIAIFAGNMLDLKDISIVIPLYNEDESLPELVRWIEQVMQTHQFTYEIVMVDDGSTDKSWEVIEQLHEKNPNIKGIRFRRNYGKSAGLNVGFENAEGKVVITMDADLQDSPDEIPALYKMIMEEGYDLVSGWKKKRHDPISKTIPTKLYNGVTSRMSGIKLHDMNCGLKAYRYEVIKNIEVYGEMHRYIPVIAKWAGFKKIGEKVVQHQARKFGTTKFGGLERFIRGPLDLLSIMFVSKFGKRPMHLFGGLGIMMFILGFIMVMIMAGLKLWAVYHHHKMRLIADDPLFYVSLVLALMGVQLFLTGFIAELVSRNATDRNNYHIKQKIGGSGANYE